MPLINIYELFNGPSGYKSPNEPTLWNLWVPISYFLFALLVSTFVLWVI